MLAAFLISFFSGLVLNGCFLKVRENARLFRASLPDGTLGVSKLGGLALVFSFFMAVIPQAKELGLCAALGFTFLLGVMDDLLDLAPFKKLSFQLLISIFLVYSGIKTQIVYFTPLANAVLSLFWFVAIMNAFNFLDILDGLAAGISVICSATFLYICFVTQNAAVGVFAAALAGSNLSFLLFNFNPARLYMGDTGSLFNGCAFASIAILISYAGPGRETALFAPLLILALPLYDLIFVMVLRWKRRVPLIKKSRDHFVLRLMDRGLSLKKAVFLMYLFSILFNTAAVLLLRSSDVFGIVLLLIAVLGWLLFAARISRARADGAHV